MKNNKVLSTFISIFPRTIPPAKQGAQAAYHCSMALIFTMLIFTAGCNQQDIDKEIKTDIFAKTKTDVNFAGLNYTVERGVVTLSGKCSSAHSKTEAEQTIKEINIVEGINDQVLIAPVIVSSDFPLKQEVDSVLTLYPAVKASVSGRIVNLTGKIEKQGVGKMLPAINKLHPGKIENNVTIQ